MLSFSCISSFQPLDPEKSGGVDGAVHPPETVLTLPLRALGILIIKFYCC